MKPRRNQKQRPTTAFDRETERRRREMIRNLSGPTIQSNQIPTSRMKIYIRDGIKPVMVPDKDGNLIRLQRRRGVDKRHWYPDRNLWRQMMTKPARVTA